MQRVDLHAAPQLLQCLAANLVIPGVKIASTAFIPSRCSATSQSVRPTGSCVDPLPKLQCEEPFRIGRVHQCPGEISMVRMLYRIDCNGPVKMSERLCVLSRSAYDPATGRLNIAQRQVIVSCFQYCLGVTQQLQ